VDKEELRERYEATGDERYYEQAKPLYEAALERSPSDARLLREYGYLRECHGRYAIRDAAVHYQRAIDADPGQEKPHFQLFVALGALGDLGHGDPALRAAGRRCSGRAQRLPAARRRLPARR